jgi:hypothetical protein
MDRKNIESLKDASKIEYTYYLLGFLAGTVETPIKDGLVVVDEETLKKIPNIIDTTYKNITAIHDYVGLKLPHYKIFSQMNEFETEIKLCYIKDGEVCETPFSFKLTSLQKSNLN